MEIDLSQPVHILEPEGNIGHFFHGYLFHAINAFLKNNKTKWIINTGLKPWETKFALLCAKHLNIEYEFLNLNINAQLRQDHDINLQNFETRDHILNIIQNIIKEEFPDIVYSGNYKVLYFRNDAWRRRMVGYNGSLDKYFDEVVYDLENKPFEEQIKLFMKCSHLVTIEGANTVNVVFMNKNAKVLSLTQYINSWITRCGLKECVEEYIEYAIANEESKFNDNILYTPEIESRIKEFIGV